MSIEKIEVRTTLGTLLTLSFTDFTSGYIVEDIPNGLGPVKAELVSSTLANLDGAKFQSSRRGTRNITMRIKLKPDFVNKTVRDLRTKLYSFFSPEMAISLRFYMLDGLTVDISATVESCEPSIFAQDPSVDLSLICFDPDFVELDAIEVDGFTVATTAEFTVDYEGSVPTGIQFILNLDRSLSEFTIYHRGPDNVLSTFDFSASLLDNDILTINSVTGNKYITLSRSGVVSSLLYGKSPQSKWISLMPGTNKFRIYAIGAGIPFQIFYTPRHGGL